MSIIYREYEEIDFLSVALLMNDFHDYLTNLDSLHHLRRMPGYGENKVAEMIQKIRKMNGKMYIANEDKKIIGFIAGYSEDTSDVDRMENIIQRYGHVIELYVSEDYRGKQVGTSLMGMLESYLRDQNCDAIVIEVFEPNKNAYNFYKKSGYIDRSIELIKKL